MSFLKRLHRLIDGFNERIGRTVAWLALAMVLVQFTVVVMRYVFGLGSIMMQESVVYMHALLFMIGAGYTLLHDGHVRVDIFYRGASERARAWADLLGVLCFLLPICVLLWIYCYPYVVRSWQVLEGSKETSGIQAVFLLKTALLVFAFLMALQGIALAARSLVTVFGGGRDERDG